LRSLPDLSFFCHSLSCCLLVAAYPSAPDLRRLHSSAPFLGSIPWRCSCLAPFLGLGGAPAQSLPRPRWSSVLWLRLCLGAPHKTFGVASVLLLGSLASSRFSSSAPVLGPIPRPRKCSLLPFFGPIPWPCFGAPNGTLCCAPVPRSRCSSLVPTGPSVLRTKPSLLSSLASALSSSKFLI
jgi:hypothetical protein